MGIGCQQESRVNRNHPASSQVETINVRKLLFKTQNYYPPCYQIHFRRWWKVPKTGKTTVRETRLAKFCTHNRRSPESIRPTDFPQYLKSQPPPPEGAIEFCWPLDFIPMLPLLAHASV